MKREKTILLIDDDNDELDIFNLALNEEQIAYICSYARNAKEALKALSMFVPDFIFLDTNMPGMNGIDCLEEIKKIKTVEEVPVIMYSTYMDDIVCKKAMKLGATACIQKPDEILRLRKILKRIIIKRSFVSEYNRMSL